MRQVKFAAIAVARGNYSRRVCDEGFCAQGIGRPARSNDGQLDSERNERIAGDNSLRGDVTGLRTDLNALRNDLTSLRTEFGTKITAMEGAVKFAMPVHFGFDEAAVRAQDQAALEKFAQVAMQHYRGATITIEGFTDPAGSQSYNLHLSRERADAVRDFLMSKGIDGATLRTVGYGKARLVRPGAARDDSGAELNRRVTFVVETPAADATVAALVGN